MRHLPVATLFVVTALVIAWAMPAPRQTPVPIIAAVPPVEARPGDPAQSTATASHRIHLATDKQIYKAGETLYLRGTVLETLTGRPGPLKARPVPAVRGLRPQRGRS